MTVVDPIQRYLRLDEKDDCEVVKVAKGVTFIATANIGNEYTSTRQIDRAISDRFQKIEVDTLSKDQEFELLCKLAPKADEELLLQISEISSQTRHHAFSEEQNLSNFLSTRFSVEMAGLAEDGFSLTEIAEGMIYPEFDKDGGVESERTFVKQIVQKFIETDSSDGRFSMTQSKIGNTMSQTHSDFWLDEEFAEKVKEGDVLSLAMHRRAISNFVSILTGKQIPVRYRVKGKSYTTGEMDRFLLMLLLANSMKL